MSTLQLCTFAVDDLLFGLEVTQVQEVILFQNMTRVPMAPPAIQGLINLRGQIVTAVDLRLCLGLARRKPEDLPMNVVIRGVESCVSLLVDTIGDVMQVSTDMLEAPPSTMNPAQRGLIEAVCKLPRQLLLILDPERAVASAGSRASISGSQAKAL